MRKRTTKQERDHFRAHNARAGELSADDVDRILDEADRCATLEEDLAASAGECLVPLPTPGSDLAKVLFANQLLAAENQSLRVKVREAEERAEELKTELTDEVKIRQLAVKSSDATMRKLNSVEDERDELFKGLRHELVC